MIKYIKTKSGQVFKAYGYTAQHYTIRVDNHIQPEDIEEEGYIDGGETIVLYPPERVKVIEGNVLRAREAETRCRYRAYELGGD